MSSCGAAFCGAPVRPNMLNMPKSASGRVFVDGSCSCWVVPALLGMAAARPVPAVWRRLTSFIGSHLLLICQSRCAMLLLHVRLSVCLSVCPDGRLVSLFTRPAAPPHSVQTLQIIRGMWNLAFRRIPFIVPRQFRPQIFRTQETNDTTCHPLSLRFVL